MGRGRLVDEKRRQADVAALLAVRTELFGIMVLYLVMMLPLRILCIDWDWLGVG